MTCRRDALAGRSLDARPRDTSGPAATPIRAEDFPWAEPWARVTTALSNAVAKLARELSWQATARQYELNWKSAATIVKRAESHLPLHVKSRCRENPGIHGGSELIAAFVYRFRESRTAIRQQGLGLANLPPAQASGRRLAVSRQ